MRVRDVRVLQACMSTMVTSMKNDQKFSTLVSAEMQDTCCRSNTPDWKPRKSAIEAIKFKNNAPSVNGGKPTARAMVWLAAGWFNFDCDCCFDACFG